MEKQTPDGRPAHGLYGPGDGILGTDIDLRAQGVTDETLVALGALMADMHQAAEKAGFLRGFAAQREIDEPGEQIPGLRYLLWDMERQMWWGPARRGYTDDMAEAGRYSEAEAVDLALQGSLGGLRHATVIVADHGSVKW